MVNDVRCKMLEGRSKRGEVFSWGTVRLRVDSGARVVAVSRGKDRNIFRINKI